MDEQRKIVLELSEREALALTTVMGAGIARLMHGKAGHLSNAEVASMLAGKRTVGAFMKLTLEEKVQHVREGIRLVAEVGIRLSDALLLPVGDVGPA